MNATQLKSVVDKSNDLFAKLKKKYLGLNGYLVFSSPRGQCELTNNMADILNYFPRMIIDCKQKDKGLQLLQKINDIEAENKKSGSKSKSTEQLRQQLDEIVKCLDVNEDTFVEIRFKGIDYNMLAELQKDELVSQEHTPQTKASIRIVLGTIKNLQRQTNTDGELLMFTEKASIILDDKNVQYAFSG